MTDCTETARLVGLSARSQSNCVSCARGAVGAAGVDEAASLALDAAMVNPDASAWLALDATTANPDASAWLGLDAPTANPDRAIVAAAASAAVLWRLIFDVNRRRRQKFQPRRPLQVIL
ncbi:MAG: hypothetical protein ACLPZR_08535 [Solirubrobacteraceae bacterium]